MSVPREPTAAASMVDPEAVGPLGAADWTLADGAGRDAAGADAGVVVGAALGAVAARLALGGAPAELLHAAARPATVMMAAAMMVLECMCHLIRSRRTDRGQAV
jgi:hypothetical protein